LNDKQTDGESLWRLPIGFQQGEKPCFTDTQNFLNVGSSHLALAIPLS
jgi:hypothetical protein